MCWLLLLVVMRWLLLLIVAASVLGCDMPYHSTPGKPRREPNPWEAD